MSIEYIRNTWINDQAPPLNATNLNNVEEGTIVNNRQDLAVVKNITANANYTLSVEENQYGNIKITDTGTVLTATRNIIMNGNEHTFVFNNATAQDLTVINSGGTGIVVKVGEAKHLRNDSVNVIEFEAGFTPEVTVREYVDVSSERSVGVEEINDTGKPIEVLISHNAGQDSNNIFLSEIYINDIVHGSTYNGGVVSGGTVTYLLSFTVPNGDTYKITSNLNDSAITSWMELR